MTGALARPLTAYPEWDTTPPELPTRSRLYHLEPIGVGTMRAESLTGYIARLAQAHCVSPYRLIFDEVVPRMNKPHGVLRNGISDAFAINVNGMRPSAAATVEALGELTDVRQLRHLTLLTWVNVLCPTQLLRRKRAWCAACYEEWDASGQTVYEPLLWTFRLVTICPRHEQPLTSTCQQCNKQSLPLASCSRPGYCAQCRAWLGRPPTASDGSRGLLSGANSQEQKAIASAVGELLASSPGLRLRRDAK